MDRSPFSWTEASVRPLVSKGRPWDSIGSYIQVSHHPLWNENIYEPCSETHLLERCEGELLQDAIKHRLNGDNKKIIKQQLTYMVVQLKQEIDTALKTIKYNHSDVLDQVVQQECFQQMQDLADHIKASYNLTLKPDLPSSEKGVMGINEVINILIQATAFSYENADDLDQLLQTDIGKDNIYEFIKQNNDLQTFPATCILPLLLSQASQHIKDILDDCLQPDKILPH